MVTDCWAEAIEQQHLRGEPPLPENAGAARGADAVGRGGPPRARGGVRDRAPAATRGVQQRGAVASLRFTPGAEPASREGDEGGALLARRTVEWSSHGRCALYLHWVKLLWWRSDPIPSRHPTPV